MARSRIMYIELKTGYGDSGPAWIGRVKFSNSGRTVYFNGKAFKRSGGQGIEGNHYDLETGEEYWISGVKKDGSDRHWAGGGTVKIQADVIDAYLVEVGWTALDPKQFVVCTDIVETDIARFREIENRRLQQRR